MRKEDWIDTYEREMEYYDRSIFSHYSDSDNTPEEDYEFSMLNHYYNEEDISDDSDCIKHFQD